MTDLKLPKNVLDSFADPRTFNGKNQVNLYICQKNFAHKIVTVDLEQGVTPFFLACADRGDQLCDGEMKSAMYPGWPIPEMFRDYPLFVWYRPSQEEWQGMSPAMRAHVMNGGLELRPAHADEVIDRADGRVYVRGKKLT